MSDSKLRLDALAELDVLYKDALARGDAAQAEQIAALKRAIEGAPPEMMEKMRQMEAAMEAQAKYEEAFARGDVAQAEQFSARMRALAGGDSPAHQEMEKVGQGERLLLMERWAEARDVLATIDRSELPLLNRPGVLNNLAYATAQAGDPERAIELILNAMKEAEAIGADYPPDRLPFMRGTHAIALCLADKHEEAIAILETILPIEKPVRARSTRAYFLGRSYRALGRFPDAARVFKLAADGDGPFAKRAAEALAEQASQEN
jgi:tetratricopeptide (TPR) repeat protein